MSKLMLKGPCGDLPEPVSLTAEQLTEVATRTAGGLGVVELTIRMGELNPDPYKNLGLKAAL